VNFKENSILINKAIVKVGTANEERDILKSKKSRRTMPMTESTAEYLKALQARQAQNKLLLGAGYISNDFICKWEDGKPITPDYVSATFKHLLESNGLPHIRFHDLRHSSASLLVNMGFTLKEIQEWLGHSNISSTNIYAHLEYRSKERMADKVDRALNFHKAV
jgi:integrase